MTGEDLVRMPLGANRGERARVWAGEEVAASGREVLLVKRGKDPYGGTLYAFWKGEIDELEVFTSVGSLLSLTYTFTPDGYRYAGPTDTWSELLVKYGRGNGTDVELRAEPLIGIFESVFTCTRADRFCEGTLEAHENGMVRLSNELRRRFLATDG